MHLLNATIVNYSKYREFKSNNESVIETYLDYDVWREPMLYEIIEGDIRIPWNMGRNSFSPPKLWNKAIVPYYISTRFSSHAKSLIRKAIRRIQRKTCITLVPRKNEKDFVYINKKVPEACFSDVGRTGGDRGVQPLNLASGCLYIDCRHQHCTLITACYR